MKSSLLYSAAVAFVLGWWSWAFQNESASTHTLVKTSLNLDTDHLLSYLSPLRRHELKDALGGDAQLMLELINSWDKDAELLMVRGLKNIQRLNEDKYFQAQIIAKIIKETSPDELARINSEFRASHIVDDLGHEIKLKGRVSRFLPQTDVTASFLLAIAGPEEIIALPNGLRRSPLYDAKKIKKIPIAASQICGEQLYTLKPDVAFVANYTHPTTKALFKSLSLPLYTVRNIDTIDEIKSSLENVGHITNHPLQARLLSLFMESALFAIDNRISALSETQFIKNILYLFHHHHFMIPTTKCLSGQLIERACALYPGMSSPIPKNESHWRLPFEQEKILQAKPDCLLIASPSPALPDALLGLPAAQTRHVFHLDEYVQESPNQYVVLAYYDIFHALEAAHCL